MKKQLLFSAFILVVITNSFAQSVINVSGDITSNTIWSGNNQYVLNGFVYVTNNATLTVQPGTIIKGDKVSKGSLIVTRGSKIIADGTYNNPIIFTSGEAAGTRTYGDWGGLILCGLAPINDPAGEKVIEGGVDAVKGLYGGTNAHDNSGILRYVRIEFAGIAFMPNNEINGLTCGGVGDSTIIDYVQVSFSGDDSYEWFGGTVNAKHLIALRGLDDDFDTDYGFSGKLQYIVSLRDSNVADISGSNGFESDNDATGTTNNPFTHAIITNATIIGPLATSSTVINANYKRGAHLRRSTKESIYNSVIIGFPTGLLVDGTNAENNATNNDLQFRKNIMAGCTTPLAVVSGSSWNITNWFNTSGFDNSILTNSSDVLLTDAYNYNSPNFIPQVTSPVLTGADFTNSNLTDPFFDAVTYRGAFDNNDWTAGWADFQPQNNTYGLVGIKEIRNVIHFNIYPNPVNGGNGTISLSLSRNSDVEIKMFDVLGALVERSSFQNLDSGNHTLFIKSSGLIPGVYNVTVTTNEGTGNSRLLVVE